MANMRLSTVVATLSFVAAACSPVFPDGATVPTGIWAGDHIVLDVTGSGAQVTFDCAHGTLDEPMKVDSAGRFDVKGSLTAEGGPTPQVEHSRPARYSGRLQDSTITLSVLMTDTTEAAGSFTLTRGATPRLRKCQ